MSLKEYEKKFPQPFISSQKTADYFVLKHTKDPVYQTFSAVFLYYLEKHVILYQKWNSILFFRKLQLLGGTFLSEEICELSFDSELFAIYPHCGYFLGFILDGYWSSTWPNQPWGHYAIGCFVASWPRWVDIWYL